MPRTDFSSLPDDARLWVFGTDRPLEPRELTAVLGAADDHLESWAAHGVPITGARAWLEDRFLAIAADERASGVSGCSIDRLFALLGRIEDDFDMVLRDAGRIWYRAPDGAIRCIDRPGFGRLAGSGSVTGDTAVFDPTIRTVGSLRQGKFEKPLRESWHAKAFRVREGSVEDVHHDAPGTAQ